MSAAQEMFSTSIDAKWHTLYLDVLQNDKGRWLQIAETRPNGHRQAVVLEEERWPELLREVRNAVSVVSASGESQVSAKPERARAYDPCSSAEDDVLRFLFQSGARIAALASVLQRERSAIRSRLRHLELEVNEA